MITQNYSWQPPHLGQEPYHAAFDLMISAIDAAIHSLQALQTQLTTTVASTRQQYSMEHDTLVLSFHPHSQASITGPYWQTLSGYPMGAAMGTFTVNGPASDAWFDVRLAWATSIAVWAGASTSHFRASIDQGQLILCDSAWRFSHVDPTDQPAHLAVWAVASLGPGQHSFTLQGWFKQAIQNSGMIFRGSRGEYAEVRFSEVERR